MKNKKIVNTIFIYSMVYQSFIGVTITVNK